MQCEYYALEGLSALLGTINKVKAALRPGLELEGLVLTMFDRAIGLSHEISDEVRKHFPEKVFQSVIPRSVRLSESPSHGLSVLEYEPKSAGAEGYRALAAEIIARGEGQIVERRNLILSGTRRGFHTSLGRGDPCTRCKGKMQGCAPVRSSSGRRVLTSPCPRGGRRAPKERDGRGAALAEHHARCAAVERRTRVSTLRLNESGLVGCRALYLSRRHRCAAYADLPSDKERLGIGNTIENLRRLSR